MPYLYTEDNFHRDVADYDHWNPLWGYKYNAVYLNPEEYPEVIAKILEDHPGQTLEEIFKNEAINEREEFVQRCRNQIGRMIEYDACDGIE